MFEDLIVECKHAKTVAEVTEQNLIDAVKEWVLPHIPKRRRLLHVGVRNDTIYVHVGWGIGDYILFSRILTLDEFADRYVKSNK